VSEKIGVNKNQKIWCKKIGVKKSKKFAVKKAKNLV